MNRADNSVRYGVQAAGVTFAALCSSGYDSTIPNGANVPGATKVWREMSATLTYDRGPVSAGVTYDQLRACRSRRRATADSERCSACRMTFVPLRC